MSPSKTSSSRIVEKGELGGLYRVEVREDGIILASALASTYAEAERRVWTALGWIAADDAARPAPAAAPKAVPLPGRGAVEASAIQMQPRARILPIPQFFYPEEGSDRRGWRLGNGVDSPTGGHHQVDPRRESSMTPTMPDVLLARTTGNAYPPRYDAARMNSTEAYRKLVTVSHVVYRLLQERGVISARDIRAAVEEEVRDRFDGGEIRRKVVPCILDTLRDLRLYGLARTDQATCTRTTLFTRVSPDQVLLVGETVPPDETCECP